MEAWRRHVGVGVRTKWALRFSSAEQRSAASGSTVRAGPWGPGLAVALAVAVAGNLASVRPAVAVAGSRSDSDCGPTFAIQERNGIGG